MDWPCARHGQTPGDAGPVRGGDRLPEGSSSDRSTRRRKTGAVLARCSSSPQRRDVLRLARSPNDPQPGSIDTAGGCHDHPGSMPLRALDLRRLHAGLLPPGLSTRSPGTGKGRKIRRAIELYPKSSETYLALGLAVRDRQTPSAYDRSSRPNGGGAAPPRRR